MTYRIEWSGEPRPEYEEQLRKELDQFCGDVISNLISHVMMVDGASVWDDGKPSVSAHWDEQRKCIIAEYTAETYWDTIKDLDNN